MVPQSQRSFAVKSKHDEAIIYCHNRSKLEVLLYCNVDDFLWGGTPELNYK